MQSMDSLEFYGAHAIKDFQRINFVYIYIYIYTFVVMAAHQCSGIVCL